MPIAGKNMIGGNRQDGIDYEALEAKREYNIKLREERYQRKQREQSALRKQRKEMEKRKAEKKVETAAFAQKSEIEHGLADKRNTLENAYRERNREAAILKREQRWQENTGAYIQSVLEEEAERREDEAVARQEAKTKELLRFQAAARARAAEVQRREELNEGRSENLAKKTQKTHKKELARIDELKLELEEEVDYKRERMEQGLSTSVSKNDLVNSLVPIPSVSELFCAVKTELDGIKYLKQCDLEALAKLNSKPPLLYVKRINEEHEKQKVPIPTAVTIT